MPTTDGGVLAFIFATNTEAEFHLDKQMALNIQAQDKTTCRNVAIESKPAYDIFVFGGGVPSFFTAETAPY